MSIRETIIETTEAARHAERMIAVLIAESLCGTSSKDGSCDCMAHVVSRAIRNGQGKKDDDVRA